MKNNKSMPGENYSFLKKKLFLRMMTAAMIVAGVCIGVYAFLRGRTATAIIEYLITKLDLSLSDSYNVYRQVIRNRFGMIISAALIVLCVCVFVAAFWVISSYIIKLFHQVNGGLEAIVHPDDQMQQLPDELEFIEQRLEHCRRILNDREQEVKTAEQKKNDLVVYLAHDIKTPLTSVIGYLNLLHEAPDMPAVQRIKYTGITLDKAYRLEELINEFFEITRYNLQSEDIQKEEIDLYYMIVQMKEEFYPILAAKEQKVNLHADESLKVYGDPDKLARVFNNILKNAAVYGSFGSTIDINACKKEQTVEIAFANQGKTIPAQKLQSVFDKFFRIDESRSSNTGGAGLGLAIAREIVVLHGGTIQAESEDGVTVFTVILPLK